MAVFWAFELPALAWHCRQTALTCAPYAGWATVGRGTFFLPPAALLLWPPSTALWQFEQRTPNSSHELYLYPVVIVHFVVAFQLPIQAPLQSGVPGIELP